MHRENSPLRQAEDAVLLDSSHMTIEQVVDSIIRIARERGMRDNHGQKVTVAKSAGFCFGVERAVDQVYEQIEALKNKKGIRPHLHLRSHYPQRGSGQGICRIRGHGPGDRGGAEGPSKKPGTVIIRSHGVSRHVYEILKERNVAVVDATCPFVKKIHRIVAEHSAAGEAVVIIGSPDHPEVEGIKGWGMNILRL